MEQTTFLQYLEYERRFSPHTLIAYKSDLNQFATYLQNVYEINEAKTVRHAHIRSWIVELIGQGCANRSINRKLSSLKAYFRFLRKRGYIDHNPMLKVIAPKMGKRLPVFVREDRLADLFSQIEFSDDYAGMRSRMILELLYSTGMRRSELIQLKLADLSFQQQYLKVLGKGNKERLIPFGDRLAASLKAYLALREATFSSDSTYLFLTDKGRPLYPKLVYNLVKQYLSQVTT
ncbi:MAG: tyrosine-type recombinase/integrase, partial [Bacteroidota bacterium]